MSNELKLFFKKSLKGLWSPFFRRKIKKELLNHYEDLKSQGDLSHKEALLSLGQPNELNSLYKRLFYKKLRSDFYMFSFIGVVLFVSTVLYVRDGVESYMSSTIKDYQSVRADYLAELDQLERIDRTKEENNAAIFLKSVSEKYKGNIPDSVFVKLRDYDYLDYSILLGDKKYIHFRSPPPFPHRYIVRLIRASASYVQRSSDKNTAVANQIHLAKLLYTTESMAYFRLAHRILRDEIYDKSRLSTRGLSNLPTRVSEATWSYMNLLPSIVEVEKDFRGKNYYSYGICHHAEELWFQDDQYKEILDASLPFEYSENKELIAFNKVKAKMKKECRLSFLKNSISPGPLDIDSMTTSRGLFDLSLGTGLNRIVPEQLVILFAKVPYLRNLAGRYVIWRTTTTGYEAREIYKKERS